MTETTPHNTGTEPGWRHARVALSLPESHGSVAVPIGAGF